MSVCRETPLEIYEMGTRLTKLGLGFPQYENDDVAIPALTALGYDEKDARDYAMAACWEFIIPGKGMEIPNIGALPFANIVDAVVREKLAQCADMDALLAAVRERIFASVRETLDERVVADLRASDAYWAQFEGPVDTVSNAVYDGFLKSYGTIGVKSYGACVDLLVAHFK